jgi:hypothetical protein
MHDLTVQFCVAFFAVASLACTLKVVHGTLIIFGGAESKVGFFFQKSIIIFEEAQNLQLILKTKCTT